MTGVQVQSIEQYIFIWVAAVDALKQLKEFECAKVVLIGVLIER